MLARAGAAGRRAHRGAGGRGRAARGQHVLHHRARPRRSPASRCAGRCGPRARCTWPAARPTSTPASSPTSTPRVTPFVGTADDVAAAIGAERGWLRRRRARRARPPRRAEQSDAADARLRQGAGRLRLPLRLLHHPHGPRRRPLAPGRRGAGRGAPARAQRPAGDGDDRDQRRRLPRSRAGPRARRADGGGRARPGRGARAALERRGDPRQGLAARGARDRAQGLPAPPRADAVRRRRGAARRWAATTTRPSTSSTSPACGRRAARERHDRRDRRLPDRGRARRSQRTLDARRRRRDHPRARVLRTRPGPGTAAAGARRPRLARGEEAPLAGAARRAPRSARATTGPPSSGARERVLVDKVADTQCSGYTADYTRCYLPAGAAARGAQLVDVRSAWSCTRTGSGASCRGDVAGLS